MVFNPTAPRPGPWFTPGAPQQGSPTSPGGGSWGSSSGTRPRTPQDQIAYDNAYWDQWLNSPIGQKWNQAQEEAARRAREVADADMAAKKRDLDLRADQLRQEGRYKEADILLRQGEAKLARERFQWETQYKAQELGLQRAQAWTQFSQTPDMYWSQQEFRGALGNAMAGRGPAPVQQQIAMNGSPRMKTMSDFDAIAGPGGSLAGANPSPPMPGQGGASGGGAGPTDPRHSAAAAVMKAIPPSGGTGLDDNDMAALKAVESIYLAAKPGSLERLGGARQKIAQAGLARLGYDPQLMQENYIRSGVGQGNSRAA